MEIHGDIPLSTLFYFKTLNNCPDIYRDIHISQVHAQIQRGGGVRPPPWDLSEVGSFVDVGWVGQGGGGSKSCFYLIRNFLARSLVSYIEDLFLKNPNHFQVQKGTSSPSSSYAQSFVFIPGLHANAFRCLFCLKLHDYTPFKPKSPRPPPIL